MIKFIGRRWPWFIAFSIWISLDDFVDVMQVFDEKKVYERKAIYDLIFADLDASWKDLFHVLKNYVKRRDNPCFDCWLAKESLMTKGTALNPVTITRPSLLPRRA